MCQLLRELASWGLYPPQHYQSCQSLTTTSAVCLHFKSDACWLLISGVKSVLNTKTWCIQQWHSRGHHWHEKWKVNKLNRYRMFCRQQFQKSHEQKNYCNWKPGRMKHHIATILFITANRSYWCWNAFSNKSFQINTSKIRESEFSPRSMNYELDKYHITCSLSNTCELQVLTMTFSHLLHHASALAVNSP